MVFKFVGDAFQAAFDTAPQALKAAIAGQLALQSAPWNELGPLKVRMGLHTGDAELDPQGDEYAVSHTKNRVGRIHAIAFGGQILLSQETADLVVRQLPEGAWLKDLGEHHLKGMALPEHLFQVCAPGLVESFPPLPTSVQPAHNLPVQMTSFIGREKEIDRLRTHMVSSRLVTLTGAGGVGKTRLAIAVAEGMLDAFPRGAWLLELAPLGDPALIAPTIASLFGLRPDKGRTPREILLDYLRSKRLLLILDNCEHLIEGCAELADLILHACPEVHLLATSREALGLEGEVVFHVPSLSTPDPSALPALERLPEYAAIRLFCERAQAVVPEFTLTQTNASLLAGICQRLDGIPLALELAAARLKVLSPAQIADRLDDRFRLLTGGSRRTLPRHQTLSALIDWSYELLSAPEQALFRCLSVFSGGWTLEAAQAVGGQDVLDLLTRLVDKSLIQVVRSLNSLNRFRMLETIRQYAQVRLVEARDADSARDRHLDYYMRLAEASEPRLNTGERLACLEELRPELENFRSALDWSLENEQLEKVIMGLRLASALWYLWHTDGYRAEARTWLEKGLAIPGTKEPLYIPVRIRAAFATGWIAMFQNDQEIDKIYLRKAWRSLKRLAIRWGTPRQKFCLQTG